jgi:clan AA aspartic protease
LVSDVVGGHQDRVKGARRWQVLIETPAVYSHIAYVGKVIVKIKLTNYGDLVLFNHNATKRKPRQIEVDSLVDTGATRLYLKPSVIKKLGLQRVDAVRSQTSNGEAVRLKYEPVQLELMGRKENFDVIEVPESVPNLLGQVPLEVLDLVVDNKRQKLIPNPAHGGEQMTEEFLCQPTPTAPSGWPPVPTLDSMRPSAPGFPSVRD